LYPERNIVDNHSHYYYACQHHTSFNYLAMYVCICKQITDHEIVEAVADGACSMKQLQSQLGVATNCGECKGCVRKLLREQNLSARQPESSPFPIGPAPVLNPA
jgi:bacterioferritin-associated ferredoxin